MRAILTTVRLHRGHLLARHLRAGSHRAHAAIVGGTSISISQAPWQVIVIGFVSETEGILCGGSILNGTEVLTAGHCVYNPITKKVFPAGQILVVAGTADINVVEAEEQASVASGVRVHPYFLYNPEATQSIPDDVAVLKLKTPLVFDASVKPISLTPAGSLLQKGTPVNLTGFGQENPVTKELNGGLYSIGMTLGFSRECGGEADALFLCASTPTGSDCFGDSGSGLTVPGSPTSLAGVTDTVEVIEGKPCRDGGVGGFANIAAPEISDFIVEDNLAPPRAPRGGGASVHGVPMVGDTLSCEPGVWSNSPTFTYTFINSAGGQVLQQGPSSTYPLTTADVGRTILCQVLAANEGGTGIGRTLPLAAVRHTRHEEEEEAIARQKLAEKEAAASKRRLEESFARDAQEAAAAKKKQEEEEAAAASRGAQGVAGFQVSAPVPDAELVSTALQASLSGAVSVRISCPAAESSCSGTVTLRTLTAVTAGARSSARAKATVLTLASGSFSVRGGKVKTVTLHLSAKARTLFARSHVLHLRARLVAHDPAGATHTTQTTVTLRAPKAKRGKG